MKQTGSKDVFYSSPRQRIMMIRAELRNAMFPIKPDWRSCADFILPHRYQETVTEALTPHSRYQNIINGTATHANSILEAGMTSSICNPARAWFRLTPPDKEMAEWGPVKDWLFAVQKIMLSTFARSNFYNVVPTVFGDMATFGTACMIMEEAFDTVIAAMSFPLGQFCIGVDSRGRPNVFQRDFMLSVRQLVEKFGTYDGKTGKPNWHLFSQAVRNMWDRSSYETLVEVHHYIEPSIQWDRKKLESKYKKFYSCYYEPGNGEQVFLREKGYDYFPVMAPRWKATGQNAYATDCPGFRTIGDIRSLQFGEETIMQIEELRAKPPMVGHPDLAGHHTSQVPGGITYAETPEQFKPLFQIQGDTQHLSLRQDKLEGRIKDFYFQPIFARILEDDRHERATAAEINAGDQEKFMILGPTLTQVSKDLLDPSVDINFAMNLRQGRFPPPPPELRHQPLMVEYIDLMAQAQKMTAIGVMDRFISYGERVIALNPENADKFDFDQMTDEYAETLGVQPHTVRADDRVAKIRADRQKAQQAQATQEGIANASASAKNLAQSDMSGQNALTELAARSGMGEAT